MAKINRLPEEDLRNRILESLNHPGRKFHTKRKKAANLPYTTDEQIFNLIVSSYYEVTAQHAIRKACMYIWRDDEMLAFIAHFKRLAPQKYADFLRQERDDDMIDADLAWDMRAMEEQWHPGLEGRDYDDLFVNIRNYAKAHLI